MGSWIRGPFGVVACALALVFAMSASSQRRAFGDDEHAAEPPATSESPSSAPGHEEGGDGHDAHHDELDLSHGNATPKLEDPKAVTVDLATATLIVFLILMAVLLKFAWRPIMQGLEKRERSIAEMIAEARRNHEEARQRVEAYEKKLADASHEAQQTIAQARKDAEAAAERIRYEAEHAAKREKERAVEEIRLAKEQALQELAGRVASSAFHVASRVLEREVKPEDHQRLVQEALQQLPSEN